MTDVVCPDLDFGMGGLSIAPGEGGPTYLGVSSDYDQVRLLSLGPDAELAIPLSLYTAPLHLAVDSADVLHAVGDETHPDGNTYPGGISYAVRDPSGKWTKEAVADSDQMYVDAADFEIAPDGTPFVWWASAPPEGWSLAKRAPNGTWSSVDAHPAGTYGLYRFTLANGGAPVSLGLASPDNGSAFQLVASVGGKETTFGVPSDGIQQFVPASRPTEGISLGAPFVAAVAYPDGIHVQYPAMPTNGDVTVPSSARLLHTCPGVVPFTDGCPPPCHDLADGVADQAFAAAREASGTTYVTYVTTHVDRQITYDKTCSEAGCVCNAIVGTDASTSQLQVAAIGATGALIGTTALALPPVAPVDAEDQARFLDTKMRGTRLSIAVRIQTPAGLTVRVITLDTTAIGAPGLSPTVSTGPRWHTPRRRCRVVRVPASSTLGDIACGTGDAEPSRMSFRTSLRSFARSERTVFLGASLLLSTVVAGACGGGEVDAPAAGDGVGAAGSPDHPETGSLRVIKADLRGAVSGGNVTLTLPVQATMQAAHGLLDVSLRSVDDASTVATTKVAYDIPAGQTASLTAVLALPGDLAAQSDWVRYNVRVTGDDGLRATRSLQQVLSPYEVTLDGPATVLKGKTASYRARARDPRTKKPIAGVPVELRIAKGDGAPEVRTGTTAATGDAVFEVTIDDAGSYQVTARAATQGTATEIGAPFTGQLPGSKVLLTTDKPIYQPGQTIHLRSLALSQQGNTPIAAQPALFEVEDAKGNKVFKRTGTTDSHGVAATDFAIGPVVNMGSFTVRTTVGDAKSEKTVSVSRYALPKFKVAVQTDKAWYRAGQTVTATVDAGYFFGKSVAGADVLIEASTLDVGQTVFQKIQGKTDASGKLSFSVTLPKSLVGLPIENGNAAVDLRATVTDTAGQQVKLDRVVTVSRTGVDLALVPEFTAIVPGIENHLDLFASDPLGAPIVGATVTLGSPDGTLTGTTDDFGHADFSWTPPASASGAAFHATLVQASGETAADDFAFGAQEGTQHVVVRTDKSIYGVGDTVQVDVTATPPTSTVFVDWINGGQAVDMRTLQAADGKASFTATVDETLLGASRIEAYVVDEAGNITRSGRTVYARKNGALKIQTATDKPQYAPGEPAKVTFSVVDESGSPAVAALGVQIVDEAVFALVDAQPGLLRTYFEIDDAFAKPTYEIHAPGGSLDDLLFGASSTSPGAAQAAQKKAAAAFAALGDHTPTGVSTTSWPATASDARTKLVPYFAVAKAQALPLLKVATASAVKALATAGCTPSSYVCGQTTYADALGTRIGTFVTVWDFWGNAYAHKPSYGSFLLQSSGPDEIAGTDDDGSLEASFEELGLDALIGKGGGFGSGAGGAATAGGPPSGAAGTSATGGSGGVPTPGGAEPKVRKDFPETLYVNPSIITGADGKATVTVDMADSITTWRVSTLANSAGGKLGGTTAGIQVFQDFFADIDFPATLTRGDEVTFPVAVYNYLATPQTVKLTLSPGTWYTPLGPTTLSVDLAAGEVKGVAVPIRVETVGVQTLTVKALGSAKSDAVARMVTVVPDGKEIASSQSGSLGAGAITTNVQYPANAVPGSPHLHLDVYPAYLSQIVSGMDSLLRTPTGCFEQTTSTTWPNVLVTRYMKQTGQITPAIELKADSLISAGYQRLLTFEHPAGGFSWFGTQDPAPFLSVTAFGVMEFADMAKVHDVDPAMLARTTKWLSDQQQPDGSWTGGQSEFFSFNTSALRNTAFVTWALGAAGVTGPALTKGLAYTKAHYGDAPQDSYTLGIVANAFVTVAPDDAFTAKLLDDVEAAKKVEGDKVHWSAGATQTDFYGAGNDADVTSTALLAGALLAAGGHGSTVNGALAYLSGSRDSQGNFGSTQATIWTLRTLLLAATKGTEGAVGALAVTVDGAPFTTVNLSADQADVMTTVDLSSLATTGAHDVGLSFTGTGKLSYNVVARHNIPWKDVADPLGPVSIAVSYDKTQLSVNDTATATVKITNNTQSTENMVLVTLGIPPGFTVEGGDFDAYLKSGVLSAFETTGKQLNLYMPKLAKSETAVIQYRIRATMPVKADDGGAKAYPYYQPDKTSSAAGTTFIVKG